MKTWRSLSIKQSLMLFTALSGAVLSVVLSVVCAVFITQSVLANRLHSSQLNLQILSTAVSNKVQEMDSLLAWPSKNSTAEHYLTNLHEYETVLLTTYTIMDNQLRACSCRDYIIRYLLTDGKYRTLEVLRNAAESRLVVSSNLHELDGVVGFRDIWWAHLGTDPLTVGNQQVIPLGRPVCSAQDGTEIGYAYLSVSPRFLTDLSADYVLSDGCRLFWKIGDTYWEYTDGQLVLHDKEAFGNGRSLNRFSNTDTTQMSKLTLDGGSCYAVFVALDGTDVTLVETIPRMNFGTSVAPVLVAAIISVLFMVILALIEHGFFRRTITNPVIRLQKQIDRLSGGDLVPDPTLEWNNELGNIGRGINKMATDISVLMERKVEDEKQKQELEYQMLQGQVNPHFVFNTLYSIKWMATFQNVPGIAEMTTALARLLKSVSKGTEKLVPLYSELALLNDYFTIQQYRYGGNIIIEIGCIEDESICQDYMIPRFTLQPLVENAIFHGIEPNGGAGTVLVDILRDSDSGDVLVSIRDNGVGIEPEKLAHLLDPPPPEVKTRAVGLWNVSRRLQYHFGPEYHLQIESVPGEGTTVTIRLPAQPKEGTE